MNRNIHQPPGTHLPIGEPPAAGDWRRLGRTPTAHLAELQAARDARDALDALDAMIPTACQRRGHTVAGRV